MRFFFCLTLLATAITAPLFGKSGQSQLGEDGLQENYFPLLVGQFYLGYQGLRSHEYVLSEDGVGNSRGHKSELEWNSFKNLLLGASISGQLRRLRYLLRVAVPLSLGKNYIYNYDWQYKDSVTEDAISNYSRHDTVQMFGLDILLRLGYSLLDKPETKVTLGSGLFVSHRRWEAFDGQLRYFIDRNGKNTNLSKKTPGHNLGYTVWLFSLQAYLEFIQNFSQAWELSLSLAYSPVTIWYDVDKHYQRKLAFTDYGFWGQEISARLQFSLWLRRRTVAFSLGLRGRYLFETRGWTRTSATDSKGNIGKGISLHQNSSGIEQGRFEVYGGIRLALPKRAN